MIELLAVMTLIAMLIALVFGAAQFVIKNARQQQAINTANALQVAIANYRHEYGHWPIPGDSAASGLQTGLKNVPHDSTLQYPLWTIANIKNPNDVMYSVSVTFSNTANYLVFDMLRNDSDPTAKPTDNPNNIRFIDDSTVMAVSQGQLVRRFTLRPSGGGMIPSGYPLGYLARDHSISNFNVTISFETETVTVGL